MAERVANLEALSENPDVSDSLADVQTRYDKVRNRARVCSYYLMENHTGENIPVNNKNKLYLIQKK